MTDKLKGVKPVRKKLLNDICATFKPGKLTAILGATGAGKTTTLNLISHRAMFGQFTGLRMLNGAPIDALTYEKIMRQQGYVTQTAENFFDDLSVYDTLLYSAMMMLQDDMPMHEKLSRVDTVLMELGLQNVAEKLMADITFRNKKRVSIAVEMLRQPSLLMLDEPTTGLDATAALKLVHTLSTLARTGPTATLVEHLLTSPRSVLPLVCAASSAAEDEPGPTLLPVHRQPHRDLRYSSAAGRHLRVRRRHPAAGERRPHGLLRVDGRRG